MICYISAPMRGIPQKNWPLFITAAADLRAAGYSVLSPVEHAMKLGFDARTMPVESAPDIRKLLLWDCGAVLNSDILVYLQDWENSRGARAEVALAKAVNIPVMSLDKALALILEQQWENR